MGFTTGNLLTMPNLLGNEALSQEFLLRYKAGLLCRFTLSDKFKLPRPFPKIKKGMVALDYGFNVVAKGYYYTFQEFEKTQEIWSLEIPLLLTMYDRDDRWLKRKHRRKGYATFARMGPKLIFEIPGSSPGTITRDNLRLTESGKLGGFNLMWSVGGGFLQNTKKGNTFSFHISGNIGFFSAADLDIEYADEIGILDNFNIDYKGSYVETALIYLFDPRNIFKIKEVEAPIIYNPRY